MTTAVFDLATQLQAPGAAITATASSTGVQLNPRFLTTCDWVVYVSGVLGTGTYTFTLEVSDLVGGSYTAIATLVWPPGVASGKVNVPINANLSMFKDNDSRFVRCTATLGATSSIIWGSYLAKSANKLGLGVKQGDIVTYA